MIRQLNNELVDLTMLNAQCGRESVNIKGFVNQNLISQEYLDTIYRTFSKTGNKPAEME